MISPLVRNALHGVDGPVGVIDRDALELNAAMMRLRAGDLSIRVASKSLRVPEAMRWVLDHQPAFRGILGYAVREAVDLVEEGFEDILVAYPAVNREGLHRLSVHQKARREVTLMVDSIDHLRYIQSVMGQDLLDPPEMDEVPPIRVAIDVDAALRVGERFIDDRIHIGPRRSPVRTPLQAVDLARAIMDFEGFDLVGIMAYEGQIAGLGNGGNSARSRVIRLLQDSSARELRTRRRAVIDGVRAIKDLEFVNGGGTGSLEVSAAEGSLTELSGGSGLFAPALFDHYRHFRPVPAAFFACPVVRRPARGWATVFEGGWVASGPAGADRLPVVAWPEGLKYNATEGPGEVQTPLRGPSANLLSLGDLVFFRHAKSGELSEHLEEYLVVSGGEIVDTWKTYRGKEWVY